MRTIFKYPIQGHTFALQIPRLAKPLCVQTQGGKPMLWCEVVTENEKVPRSVYVFGTGHQIPATFQGKYVGTFQTDSALGLLVFHVYLGPEPPVREEGETESTIAEPVRSNGPATAAAKVL